MCLTMAIIVNTSFVAIIFMIKLLFVILVNK